MMYSDNDVCRLCLELITEDKKGIVINDVAFHQLVKPLLQSSFFPQELISSFVPLENYMVCETCLNDTKTAIKLSATLKSTKETLRTAANGLGCKTVSLRWLPQFSNIPETSSVCTVCFKIVSSSISLNKSSSSSKELPNQHLLIRKMLLNCKLNMPRMVLDPVICYVCWSNLQIVSTFRKTIDDVQHRVELFCHQNSNSYARNADLLAIVSMKSSSKAINCEANSERMAKNMKPESEDIDIMEGGLDLTTSDTEEETSDVDVGHESDNVECDSTVLTNDNGNKIANIDSLTHAEKGYIQNYLEHDLDKIIRSCGAVDSPKSQIYDFDRKTRTWSPLDMFKRKRPFDCPFCGYTTTADHSVFRHMLLHKESALEWYKCTYCDYKVTNIKIFHEHVNHHNVPKKKVHDEVIIDYASEDDDQLNVDTGNSNIVSENLEQIIGVKKEQFIKQTQHEKLNGSNSRLQSNLNLNCDLRRKSQRSDRNCALRRKSQRSNKPLNSYKEPPLKELLGSNRRKKSQHTSFSNAKNYRLSGINGTHRKVRSNKKSAKKKNVGSNITNRNYIYNTRNAKTVVHSDALKKDDKLKIDDNSKQFQKKVQNVDDTMCDNLSSDDSFEEDCYVIENNKLPTEEVVNKVDILSSEKTGVINPDHQNERVIHIDSDDQTDVEVPNGSQVELDNTTNEIRSLQIYLEHELQVVKSHMRNPLTRRADPEQPDVKFKRDKIFICPLCNFTTCSDLSVYRHMIAHKRGLIEIHKCAKCPYKIFSLALLQEHIIKCMLSQNNEVLVIDDDEERTENLSEDNVVTITESDIYNGSESDEDSMDTRDDQSNETNIVDNRLSNLNNICTDEPTKNHLNKIGLNVEELNKLSERRNLPTVRGTGSIHDIDHDANFYIHENILGVDNLPSVNLDNNSSNEKHMAEETQEKEAPSSESVATVDILDAEDSQEVQMKGSVNMCDLPNELVKETSVITENYNNIMSSAENIENKLTTYSVNQSGRILSEVFDNTFMKDIEKGRCEEMTVGTAVARCEQSHVTNNHISLHQNDSLHGTVSSSSAFATIVNKELINIMQELNDCIDMSRQK